MADKDHAGSGGRQRERKISEYVDSAERGKRSSKPSSKRHPSSNTKSRRARVTRVDPDKYRVGDKGEKSYGAPTGTQSERNKKRKK